MPKLENFATHIKVNGNPFAKNTVNYQVTNDDTIALYYTNDRDRRIIEKTLARFDDWTDSNDTAYISFAALTEALDSFLFSSFDDSLPHTAFGEISVAELTPQVQVKFPNGVIPDNTQVLTNKAGSSVAASNGLCTLTLAGVAEAFTQIRTLDVVRYGAGQGMRVRFTGMFEAGIANSTFWVGPGDDDEMLGFGNNGAELSILHRRFGELEVRDITFTGGGDAGGGTFTLTLDDTPITITVPAGSATIADICALVVAASADVFNAGRGWEVHTDDSITVTFISLVAENATGTFSFADVDSGVTAGAFSTVLTGVAPTEVITAQSDWNIDKMDGSGPSGMTIDKTKINVFDVAFQYLGAGGIAMAIEVTNTGKFQVVHFMRHAGIQTHATFRNPTLHLNIIGKTESGFSGAAQTCATASMGGFIEGHETISGTRKSTKKVVSTNGTTEVCGLVIHNEETFKGTRNKVIIYPDHITLVNAATRDVVVRMVLGPTHIDSGVTLAPIDSNNSVIYSGSATGSVQGGEELIDFAVTRDSSKDIDISHLNLALRPNETMIFPFTKESGGADGNVTVGVSWLERI